eukprot:jgi/Undpi1/12509/HiC_scaffold_6.g02178.m1
MRKVCLDEALKATGRTLGYCCPTWSNYHTVWKLCFGTRSLNKLKFALVVTEGSPVVGKPCEAAAEGRQVGEDINTKCTGDIKVGDLLKKARDHLLDIHPAFHSHRATRAFDIENMRFDVLKAIVAILSISVLPVATPAPCTTETIVMEVASAADLETMSNAINCTGEGTFHVTWIGSLQLHQSIDISDNKQLTITGSNPVPETVIDGGNATNIVSVSGGSTLNLVSLVLNGGNSDEGGAVAARDFSVVNVVGCSFTNNNASLGGAILAYMSEINIDGETTLAQNTAQRHGGAIYGRNSEIGIGGNTAFKNNSAGNTAGAVFSQQTDVQVAGNTSFEHNIADVDAGAVYVFTAVVNMAGDTYFGHNFANNSGGAIYAEEESSMHFDNAASFHHNFVSDSGGAIWMEDSEMHVDGLASFEDNVCLRSGGG